MDRLRHLVVIVPGIGGSVLTDARGERVWGPKLGGIAGALLRPDRLNLAEHPSLAAVDLLPTISVVPPVWRVPGYDRLLARIIRAFPGAVVEVATPGSTATIPDVLTVPYDFRRGIVAAAEHLRNVIDSRLRDLTSDGRRRRVIVIGHSMGGLVARYWLGPLGGADDCAGLITVGTPHGGAPKALNWLVNGVRLGPKRFDALTNLLRDWPSVYDLLPRYPAVAGTRARYPHDLNEYFPGFVNRAKNSHLMHQDIDAAWAELDQRPLLSAIYSRGHGTAQRGAITGDRLSVTEEPVEWMPNPDWLGDGTVPAFCAIPNDLDDPRARIAVPERHLPMASTSAITELLVEYAAGSFHSVRGDVPEQPWLGLDLADTYQEGESVTIGVRLLGARYADAVWVRLRPLDGGPGRWRTNARQVHGGWLADIPGLPPGAYDVLVDAVGVPDFDQVRCQDVVGVVGAREW
ncbi:hypothetical protein AB0J55_17420 [Amycolatopsis sp. NPDC049688]|uniref:esterase/lipase family protein n=1 Tax=Amycolatopsis sp. NPDC049688 TaxID=3154733 RepID=UPI00343BF4C8